MYLGRNKKTRPLSLCPTRTQVSRKKPLWRGLCKISWLETVLGVNIQASTNLLEQWYCIGVGLKKCLDSSQARAYPCLSSEQELHIHSNSQMCRPLPSLAALQRRRCYHRPRTQLHIRIAVQKNDNWLRCRRRLRFRERSLAMRIINGWVTESLV